MQWYCEYISGEFKIMEPAVIISMKIIKYSNQENLNDYLEFNK
jgi:hypothetical protein